MRNRAAGQSLSMHCATRVLSSITRFKRCSRDQHDPCRRGRSSLTASSTSTPVIGRSRSDRPLSPAGPRNSCGVTVSPPRPPRQCRGPCGRQRGWSSSSTAGTRFTRNWPPRPGCTHGSALTGRTTKSSASRSREGSDRAASGLRRRRRGVPTIRSGCNRAGSARTRSTTTGVTSHRAARARSAVEREPPSPAPCIAIPVAHRA